MRTTNKKAKKPEKSQTTNLDSASVSPVSTAHDTGAPVLARRKINRNSTIRSGRTISEKRERLETRNERMAARKKDKKKAARRITFTTIAFIILGTGVVYLGYLFFNYSWAEPPTSDIVEIEIKKPTIEVIDEDASVAGNKITSRMLSYISQAEQDFRDLGYTPIKAVIPSGAIREVDFYLEGNTGFIKTTIDRSSAVSVEDADRMLRYLSSNSVPDFQYIDVRIDHRAYWK